MAGEMELPGSNTQDMAVLELLKTGKEKYGLQMVKENEKKLGRASIYVVLQRMVARGWIEARLETDEEQSMRGPKRRLYKITGYGLKVYNARLAVDAAAARALRGVVKPAGAI